MGRKEAWRMRESGRRRVKAVEMDAGKIQIDGVRNTAIMDIIGIAETVTRTIEIRQHPTVTSKGWPVTDCRKLCGSGYPRKKEKGLKRMGRQH